MYFETVNTSDGGRAELQQPCPRPRKARDRFKGTRAIDKERGKNWGRGEDATHEMQRKSAGRSPATAWKQAAEAEVQRAALRLWTRVQQLSFATSHDDAVARLRPCLELSQKLRRTDNFFQPTALYVMVLHLEQ